MSKYQVVKELHKPARKNCPRRSVIVRGLDECFESDLIEMIPYAKFNRNCKYILVCIDRFLEICIWKRT